MTSNNQKQAISGKSRKKRSRGREGKKESKREARIKERSG
jgi:hypothetical protein